MKGLKKINSIQKKEIDDSYKTISNLKDKISKLTEQIKQKYDENDEDQKYRDILSDLYEKGLIDEEGNAIHSEVEKEV